MRIAILIAAVIACAATTAHAETYYFGGNECNAQTADLVFNPIYGPYNVSSSTNQVLWCGTKGVEITSSGMATVSATVYDRHSTENVSCTLYVISASGYAVYTNTQATTSWSWSPMTLNWTVAFTGGDFATIKCTVPKVGTGYSHVTSYKVVD